MSNSNTSCLTLGIFETHRLRGLRRVSQGRSRRSFHPYQRARPWPRCRPDPPATNALVRHTWSWETDDPKPGIGRTSAGAVHASHRCKATTCCIARVQHHLDARQVGASMVRGVRSGVPHHCAVARRFRSCKRPAPADAEDHVRPSERADFRLRMELQRREPACPRLGDALSVQCRARTGPCRPLFPGAIVPGPAAEPQLVVNRKDREGRNEFAGGFLGLDTIGVFDRRTAPKRRTSGSGGRDRMDGLLVPELLEMHWS